MAIYCEGDELYSALVSAIENADIEVFTDIVTKHKFDTYVPYLDVRPIDSAFETAMKKSKDIDSLIEMFCIGLSNGLFGPPFLSAERTGTLDFYQDMAMACRNWFGTYPEINNVSDLVAEVYNQIDSYDTAYFESSFYSPGLFVIHALIINQFFRKDKPQKSFVYELDIKRDRQEVLEAKMKYSEFVEKYDLATILAVIRELAAEFNK